MHHVLEGLGENPDFAGRLRINGTGAIQASFTHPNSGFSLALANSCSSFCTRVSNDWLRSALIELAALEICSIGINPLPRSAGRKVRFRGMSVFELEGRRIGRYREYFDTGAALLQLGFAPESMARVLGRRL